MGETNKGIAFPILLAYTVKDGDQEVNYRIETLDQDRNFGSCLPGEGWPSALQIVGGWTNRGLVMSVSQYSVIYT